MGLIVHLLEQDVEVLPGYLKIKEKQKFFQIDNGLRYQWGSEYFYK
jgi:hypothetical protein